MRKRIGRLGAASVMVALLVAGCEAGNPAQPGGSPGSPAVTATTRARPAAPASNGIASKPINEIIGASQRAFRSARSVRVRATGKDQDGTWGINLKLNSKHEAAGWLEHSGIRVDLIVAGGRVYIRSPKLFEQQGGAELARLIGNRWVLVPRESVRELTPFGDELSIAALANDVFSTKTLPRFIRKSNARVGSVPAVRLSATDGSYYVAATGKPYPLLLDHAGDDEDMTFSEYDRSPTITAPRGALDVQKLRP
jgi:hypothetical protein